MWELQTKSRLTSNGGMESRIVITSDFRHDVIRPQIYVIVVLIWTAYQRTVQRVGVICRRAEHSPVTGGGRRVTRAVSIEQMWP